MFLLFHIKSIYSKPQKEYHWIFLELFHNLSQIFIILWQVTFLNLSSMGKSKAVKWIRNFKYLKLAHSKCKLLHDNWYEIKKKVNKLDFEVTFVKILFNVHINEAKCIDISSCTTRFILQAYVWKKKDYWTSLG